ncbi:hypothetical protein [Kibdelosporangium aridum]|uniref:hypothetical protein n=1 Tax=Kibdelosporangium aridum TaxID=2030 RepID=UPI001358679D|nr:hypothetical protein [Kibdelosporangium aridum]
MRRRVFTPAGMYATELPDHRFVWGRTLLAMVNAVNLEFCGEPWRPPAGRTSVQDVRLML